MSTVNEVNEISAETIIKAELEAPTTTCVRLYSLLQDPRASSTNQGDPAPRLQNKDCSEQPSAQHTPLSRIMCGQPEADWAPRKHQNKSGHGTQLSRYTCLIFGMIKHLPVLVCHPHHYKNSTILTPHTYVRLPTTAPERPP